MVWIVFNGKYLYPCVSSFSCFSNMYKCVWVCVPARGCRGWDTQQSYNRRDQSQGKHHPSLASFSFCHCWWQPPLCVLSELVCSFLWACSCSEGEVKEKRLLMQVVTELAAPVSCLVCSKSSGTPLGKMRGLITVKLANEQVNYRTKFLYKNCHFSERCSSSCSKCLKKKEMQERVGGGGRERTEDKLLFPLFSCFKKTQGF